MTVSLFRARAKLGEKEKSLLVIDEVFDYLDDASLLVAQHFLLELMKQFKDAGKSIYVVILTHRDPSQFKSFRFKKLHASYISPVENGAEKGCLHKILVDRGRCKRELQHIYEAVSSHYLHFSDCQAAPQDVRAYVAQQMLGNAPKEPASFRNEMESRLGDYFSEKPFSSSEVCCGIRIAVDMKHRRRKKPSRNIRKSRKAPRKGFVMRKRMASKRPRRFTCWVPSITAACIFPIRQGSRRSFEDNSGTILSGI